VEIRHPAEHEIEQLKEIWRVCFGDEEEYIQFYFSNAYQAKNTLVCVEENVVAAMMTCLPCLFSYANRIEKGSYIYAVATRPEYRNRGLMTQLQRYAEDFCRQRGDCFMTLVPATESLFSMYEKVGYQVWTDLAYEDVCAHDYQAQSVITKLEPVSDSYFVKLRQFYLSTLPASVALDGRMLDYASKELREAGCVVLSVQNQYGTGYVVCYQQEDQSVLIREVGMSRDCFDGAVCAVAEYFHTDRMQVKMNESLSQFGSMRKPYSMVLWLEQTVGQDQLSVYMNLMLD
jgi:predicted acetyltransferase